MYKVHPDVKEMLHLSEKTTEELKKQYNLLVSELKIARNAYEFERASDVKTEMVYIIEELKNRKELKTAR
ncbi:hypothetical protein [Evansella clarkii]|jgi:hypothetical protein|uniref:hypothetical protein n=1 Tax=Evansella clarkii TaxID=79879 RepID=UPI0009964ADD|nr:hypothetical protein [Evansella clarkii]